MEFSNYYKTILDSSGVPKLNLEQHRRLFNIIHLEGQLLRIQQELKQFGHNAVTTSYKNEVLKKLEKLYGHAHPASVFSEMLDKSKKSESR